jgi:cellulose synthase (UDP-forming)
MNPRLLLSLWRERWDKNEGQHSRPLNPKSKFQVLADWLAESPMCQHRAYAAPTLCLCFLLLISISTIGLTHNSQIVFTCLIIVFVIYIRRFAGFYISMLLVCLSCLVTARYLYWRFDATLAPMLNLDFVLGFGLAIAELYVSIFFLLQMIQNLWPLKQKSIALTNDSSHWPTVDVFISANGAAYDSIKSSAHAALLLDWPQQKIKAYIVDSIYRADIKQLADSLGILYQVHDENDSKEVASSLNQALLNTDGELIAVFDGSNVPDPDFLKLSVGWFIENSNLGMLQTPNHFIAIEAVKESWELFDQPSLGGKCAVIRRTMLLEVGGLTTGSLNAQTHTANKFQKNGFVSAYVGFFRPDKKIANTLGSFSRRTTGFALEAYKVDHPFFVSNLKWRQKVKSLQDAMKFYGPIPKLIFLLAPLAFLLLNANIIQASFELFLAYAASHFVLRWLVLTRMRAGTWQSVWKDMSDTLLAWYMLLPAMAAFLKTKFTALFKAHGEVRKKSDDTFDWIFVSPLVVCFLLNFVGFLTGTWHLISNNYANAGASFIYIAWAIYNLALISAMFAVAYESRHIRDYRNSMLRLPVMLKVFLGRTVYCNTVNFPDSSLHISLPTPVHVDKGSELGLSIFRDHREYVLNVSVISSTDSLLIVDFKSSKQDDYQALMNDVFSRGQAWPQWLPNRDTDRPLPAWAYQVFDRLNEILMDSIRKMSVMDWNAQVRSWIQTWIIRK